MTQCLVFFALCVASISAELVLTDLFRNEWLSFKLLHQKLYENTSIEDYRVKVYLENRNLIAKHNQRYALGLESFDMAENEFADMTHEEFLTYYTGGIVDPSNYYDFSYDNRQPSNTQYFDAPESIDWRKDGAVTDVKNQGRCGSCWAFSATGALEAHTFIKTKKLVPLSEQNLIDCSKSYGNHGCKGGLMTSSFKYIKENKGIDTEESYEYVANDIEGCRYTPENSGASLTSYVELPENDEENMKKIIGVIGPVAVAIEVTHKFQFYHTGVFYDASCKPSLNHGVLAVGYDTDTDGEYWIVKNSWGQGWGDKGYVKMARNKGNNCGITSMACYPVIG